MALFDYNFFTKSDVNRHVHNTKRKCECDFVVYKEKIQVIASDSVQTQPEKYFNLI